MSDRPKLAIYWAGACGGCDISILALDEKVLQVAEAFDIVLWPCVMDGKIADVEGLADGAIAACFWSGSVRTSEHEIVARLLRRKSRLLVAFGSCAHEGGIPGLANLVDREQIFSTVYGHGFSTENPGDIRPQPASVVPEGTLRLPAFYDTVKTLDQTVDVDYTLPGCPPEAERIAELLEVLMKGERPKPGRRRGMQTTVCEQCTRARHEKKIKQIRRTWQVLPDPDLCLLEQGLVCCGIATRAGCGALCPGVNSPCIGCYGASVGTRDFGARMMSALASVIDSSEPEEVDRIVAAGIPDPVGTFYRFSLAHSLMRRRAEREAPAAR